MKYCLDFVINFNNKGVLNYYEWEIGDQIIQVKKIPLFRLKTKDFNLIKNNIVIFAEDFCLSIYQKSRFVKVATALKLNYVCLFSNTKEGFGVILNQEGKIIKWGGLLLDEESEVLVKASTLKPMSIEYKVLKPIIRNSFLTRQEQKKFDYCLNKLKAMYLANNKEHLKYLYYECFNLINNNKEEIYQQLKEFLRREVTNKHYQLYNLIMLLNKKEVMSQNP